MTARRSISPVPVALAAALALAPLAQAQEAQSGSDGQPGWWGKMGQMMDTWSSGWDSGGIAQGMGRMMGLGPDEVLDRIEGRLAFVKAELKITAQQEPAWNDFSAAMRKAAADRAGTMSSMMNEMKSGAFFTKPLPDRLADQQTRLENRLEQVKAVRVAVDKLYAVLTDDQKKQADEIVMPMMGMGGRGMGWWR
ncbi:MAG: Spy/CpxP family protein refolding chaperone [Hyphomicrobiales bacterium]